MNRAKEEKGGQERHLQKTGYNGWAGASTGIYTDRGTDKWIGRRNQKTCGPTKRQPWKQKGRHIMQHTGGQTNKETDNRAD